MFYTKMLKMKNIYLIIILILIKLYSSELNSGKKNFKNFEKKAKVLACSYLSKIFIDSVKDFDKLYKDAFNDKSSSESENETKEKVSHFMIVNCYSKITKETANNIILEISKGNKDIIKKKEYFNLFEMGKDRDMNKMKETMKEIGEVLKEIKEEEELFRKKKDSPDFEKAFKEFEEKMKKNTNDFKKKTQKENEQNYKKKKKKSVKKPYEGTKWEIVRTIEKNELNIKDIINNPSEFFEEIGMNTFSGMCIMALIVINLYQNIYNNKKKEESNINENENNIKNINNINKEEEEEEEEKEILKEFEKEEEKEVKIEKEIKNANDIIKNKDIKMEDVIKEDKKELK